MKIRVVIAEDQTLLRGALGVLLGLEEDIEIAGQAADGKEALSLISKLQPDVCLLDIEMPEKTGLEVAEHLRNENSPCKVIILTTFARPGYFERSVNAGVYGYLLKDGPSEELAEAIRNVMKGKRQIAPELIFGALEKKNPLTEREKEILRLIADGKSIQEISSTLFLSSGTIRNYLSDLFAKLLAKNRIEAVRIAEEKGWI